MKTDLFQSCGHCWVFQICWHTECSTFTASSFRIQNSSTGIPSPPPALFVVMLPKAHLTSHSRMSDSWWVITPSWLSGLWGSFLYTSFVYSCHLFLIGDRQGGLACCSPWGLKEPDTTEQLNWESQGRMQCSLAEGCKESRETSRVLVKDLESPQAYSLFPSENFCLMLGLAVQSSCFKMQVENLPLKSSTFSAVL